MHQTKDKGDLAAAKVIADLVEKEYSVFVPVVTEHAPFDVNCLQRRQVLQNSSQIYQHTHSQK